MEASSPWWTWVVYAISAGLFAAWLDWRQRRRDRHLKAAVDDNTAKTETAVALGAKTYVAMNGSGLTGTVRRIEAKVDQIGAEQTTHSANDDRRFGAIQEYLGMPEGPKQ